MAQSVKLSDGSYIDASTVYDTNAGKTQQEINSSILQWRQIGSEVTYDAAEGLVTTEVRLATIPSKASEVLVLVNIQGYTNNISHLIPTAMAVTHVIPLTPYNTVEYWITLTFTGSYIVLKTVKAAAAKTFAFNIFYR